MDVQFSLEVCPGTKRDNVSKTLIVMKGWKIFRVPFE